MRKIFLSVLIMVILLFVGYEILTNSNEILKSVNFSFSIWQNNIFPSLFPFFILSELLINYGFIELIGEIFKPIMYKLFKINGNCSFIFIMSLISGFPSSAKYTKELYDNKLINKNEAAKVLTFSHFSNPLFIMGTVSLLFLNNKEVGFLILICHYFGNIIIGLLFRNYHPSDKNYEKVSIKKAILNMHNRRIKNSAQLSQVITKSLVNTINTLLLILGVVTMFLIITTIIDRNININNFNQSILNGFVEMTQGLKYVSLLNIPLKIKAVISTMIISFGGFSVHMQMVGILSDSKINYLPFLTARVIHAIISGFLIYLIFDFWFYFI